MHPRLYSISLLSCMSTELYMFLDGLFSLTLPPVATSRQTWLEMFVSIRESSVFTVSMTEGMGIIGKCCSFPSLRQHCYSIATINCH